MTMPNDINELDEQDVGLKGIFGDRFHDATSGAQQSKKQETTHTSAPVKAEQSGAHKRTKSFEDVKSSEDAKWEPVKAVPNWTDNLMNCAKSALLFGGLNLLIFYWQQTGLMAESIAVPSMCVCAFLAGFGVGKHIVKECRR